MFRLLVVVVLFLGTEIAMAQEKEPTPVRQNPNIDRPLSNEGTTSPLVDALQKLVAVYGPIAYSNDRPNPYTRIEPWGEAPPGNMASGVRSPARKEALKVSCTSFTGANRIAASTDRKRRW